MPLFKSQPSKEPAAPARKRTGLFRRRSHSPSNDSYRNTHTSATTKSNRGGIWGRRSPSAESSNSSLARGGSVSSSTRTGGLFGIAGRHDMSHDPSILAARQKVNDAEESERAADRALADARGSVREAKEHVKFLEQEAKEDSLRAKAKQAEAKVVSKTARGLGRHG